MMTYVEARTAVSTRRSTITFEIALPWRLLAAAICLFGSADIVGMEGLSGIATGMFFAAYASLAASLTMLITKSGR